MTAYPAHRWPPQHPRRDSRQEADRLPPPALAIARSVLYASVFEYPLTLAELRQTLVESVQTPSQLLATLKETPALQRVVEYQEGFFFPAGRRDLIAERQRREARSRAFLREHERLLRLVTLLPFVDMVALSGSIAHLNLDGQGDLDLFVVTRGRRVWSAAVAIVLLAKLLGRRRTLCANFVLSDTRLELDQQDLFTASQVIHVKPLVGRATFHRLLAANPFVARFYPNFHQSASWGHERRRSSRVRGLKRAVEAVLALPWWGVEAVCRSGYRAYLRRRSWTWQSPEQVRLDDDCLKLHTKSHRQSVMGRYEQLSAEL